MPENNEEKTEEVNAAGKPQVLKKKKSILTMLMAFNSLLILGIAIVQYSMFKKQNEGTSIQDIVKADQMKRFATGNVDEEGNVIGTAQQEDGILFPLESFTANLAQGDGARRFVRMVAVLKFGQDSNEEEFQARRPQIRDAIINTLNSKRPEDLLRVEGKRFLKEEIKSSINAFLVDGEVIDVFYVSFQVN